MAGDRSFVLAALFCAGCAAPTVPTLESGAAQVAPASPPSRVSAGAVEAAASDTPCSDPIEEDSASTPRKPGRRTRRSRPRDDGMTPRPPSVREQRAIDVYERYLHDHSSPDDPPDAQVLFERSLARADALFDARRWPAAIGPLRAIAFDHPEQGAGAHAARRYVEALSAVAANTGRSSCLEAAERDVPRLASMYCVGELEHDNEPECRVIERLGLDLDRVQIEKLVMDADRGRGDGIELYGRAGARYLELAHRCCETTLRLKEKALDWRCDEIAFNSARFFRAARLLERSAEARALLLDPANRMQTSPLAKRLESE